MNITRQLPLLEHSSQLRDSFEDFEVPSPRKVIKYDPLKDARRPKKKKVMATVNKGNEVSALLLYYSLILASLADTTTTTKICSQVSILLLT